MNQFRNVETKLITNLKQKQIVWTTKAPRAHLCNTPYSAGKKYVRI